MIFYCIYEKGAIIREEMFHGEHRSDNLFSTNIPWLSTMERIAQMVVSLTTGLNVS